MEAVRSDRGMIEGIINALPISLLFWGLVFRSLGLF